MRRYLHTFATRGLAELRAVMAADVEIYGAGQFVRAGDRVTVTVTAQRELSVLGFTGLGPVGVKGTGTARAVQAVRTEGD